MKKSLMAALVLVVMALASGCMPPPPQAVYVAPAVRPVYVAAPRPVYVAPAPVYRRTVVVTPAPPPPPRGRVVVRVR
jgi:hypothetical protein